MYFYEYNNGKIDKFLVNIDVEKLIETAKLNQNQKSVYIYYLKVQQLIALELVDSINIFEISRGINFFDLSKTELRVRVSPETCSVCIEIKS